MTPTVLISWRYVPRGVRMEYLAPLSKAVVGIDLSKASRPLAEFAVDLALRYYTELLFVYVVDEMLIEHPVAGFDPNVLIKGVVEEASSLLEELVDYARGRGVKASYAIVDTPMDPAIGLEKISVEANASELVISHKGRKLFKLIPVGSVAFSLIAIASRPVIISKPSVSDDEEITEPPSSILDRILVAVDHDINDEMISYVVGLTSKAGAGDVFVVHILEPRGDEAASRRLVSRVVGELEAAGAKVTPIIIESSKPWREILAAAEQLDASSIVVGRNARRSPLGMILGSTVKKVVEESMIPVIVYPL